VFNIFYLVTTFEKDGPGNVLLNSLKKIDRKQFNPIVACLYKGGNLEKDIGELGIKTFNLNMSSPLRGWLDLKTIFLLSKLFKADEVDIVHTHLVRATVFGGIASILANIPFVATVHNMEEYFRDKNIFSLAVRVIEHNVLKHASKIVCVSNGVREYLLHHYNKIDKEKVLTIHNGVDPSLFANQVNKDILHAEFNIPDKTIIVGCIARLHRQKGIIYLLQAAKEIILTCSNQNIKFVIIGDGEEKEDLYNFVKGNNLQNYIIFTGYRKDVLMLMPEFDIFVLPSLWEGLPMALVEAMATGLPCIATDVSGNSEIVVDRVTGFIVPPRSPIAISDAIKILIGNRNLRRSMGCNGCTRVINEFSAQKMAKEYEKVYLKILEEKNAKE